MNRADAITAVESLFGDGGASVLAAARVQDWSQVFSILPDEALDVQDDGDRLAAERLLERLRDMCARGGKLREALAFTRGLLRSRVSRLGEDHPASLVELGALGQLAERAGRGEEALDVLQRAYDGLSAHRTMALAIVASNLGAARLRRGDLDGAAAALEMAYGVRKELAPATLAPTASRLAELRVKQGDMAEGSRLLREGYDLMRDQRGAQHPEVVSRARVLAGLFDRMGNHLAAEPLYRDLYQAALATSQPSAIATAGFELGAALLRVRLREEGFRHVQKAIEQTRELGDTPELPKRLSLWADLALQRKRNTEAEGALLEALEVERRLYGEQSHEVAIRTAAIGHLYAQQGRRQEAMGWLDPAVSLLRSTRGDKDQATRVAVGYLLDLLDTEMEQARLQRDRALERHLAEHALEMCSAVLGKGDVRTNRLRDRLAR